MTTTSASAGYIDYAAFGLSPEDLRSLRALTSVWKDALMWVAERFGSSGALQKFVERTAELPLSIADIGWQREQIHIEDDEHKRCLCVSARIYAYLLIRYCLDRYQPMNTGDPRCSSDPDR